MLVKIRRLEGFADRLMRKAGLEFRPRPDGEHCLRLYRPIILRVAISDCPPDDIEDLVDELEEHEDPAAFLKTISAKQAGWMARFIENKCQRDSETLGMNLESELAVRISLFRWLPGVDHR